MARNDIPKTTPLRSQSAQPQANKAPKKSSSPIFPILSSVLILLQEKNPPQICLLTIFSSLSRMRRRNSEISIAILKAAARKVQQPFFCLLIIVGICSIYIFVIMKFHTKFIQKIRHDKAWSLLDLGIYLADILSDYAKTEKL